LNILQILESYKLPADLSSFTEFTDRPPAGSHDPTGTVPSKL
jgi:hypothetical protein